MKRVWFSRRSAQPLHIEAPGCIVNLRAVTDVKGRPVTSIEIIANGNRYRGDPEWWIEDKEGLAHTNVRIVRRA